MSDGKIAAPRRRARTGIMQGPRAIPKGESRIGIKRRKGSKKRSYPPMRGGTDG